MSNIGKVIVLPSSQEIMRRLCKVHDDDMLRGVYAFVAAKEGTELVAASVVWLFMSAIWEKIGHEGMLPRVAFGWIPLWIDAIVDDKDVASEAKALLKEAAQAPKQERPTPKPPITNERQALDYLKWWITKEGWKGEVHVLAAYGDQGEGVYLIDVMKPYGRFRVFENGNVTESYGTFRKELQGKS